MRVSARFPGVLAGNGDVMTGYRALPAGERCIEAERYFDERTQMGWVAVAESTVVAMAALLGYDLANVDKLVARVAELEAVLEELDVIADQYEALCQALAPAVHDIVAVIYAPTEEDQMHIAKLVRDGEIVGRFEIDSLNMGVLVVDPAGSTADVYTKTPSITVDGPDHTLVYAYSETREAIPEPPEVEPTGVSAQALSGDLPPLSNLNKDDLIAQAEAEGVEVDESWSKADILAAIKEHRAELADS